MVISKQIIGSGMLDHHHLHMNNELYTELHKANESIAHYRDQLRLKEKELQVLKQQRFSNHPGLTGWIQVDKRLNLTYVHPDVSLMSADILAQPLHEGETLTQTLDIKSYQTFLQYFHKALRGHHVNGEKCFTTISGELRCIRFTFYPPQQPEEPVSIEIRDITKEKENSSQPNFVVSDIFHLPNCTMSDDLHLMDFNDAFATLLDYERQELNNTCLLGLIDRDERPALIRFIKSLGECNFGEGRFCLTGNHGQEVQVKASVSSFKCYQSTMYFLMFDILTDHELSQELLQHRSEELKKVNAELDHFVYSASHDLRAPLLSMLGLINISKMEQDPSRLADYYDLMTGSINKLDRFIQNIIHYSSNARTEVFEEAIQFQSIIEEIISQNKEEIEKKDIHFNFAIKQISEFAGDKNRIHVILKNLITNAIKFSHFTKPEKYIDIAIEITTKHVNISIKDNGEGISSAYQDKIFNMFYKATTSSTGAGLGLYIVRETINKLEGDIKVTSKLGEGSTFEVMIPNKYNV